MHIRWCVVSDIEALPRCLTYKIVRGMWSAKLAPREFHAASRAKLYVVCGQRSFLRGYATMPHVLMFVCFNFCTQWQFVCPWLVTSAKFTPRSLLRCLTVHSFAAHSLGGGVTVAPPYTKHPEIYLVTRVDTIVTSSVSSPRWRITC